MEARRAPILPSISSAWLRPSGLTLALVSVTVASAQPSGPLQSPRFWESPVFLVAGVVTVLALAALSRLRPVLSARHDETLGDTLRTLEQKNRALEDTLAAAQAELESVQKENALYRRIQHLTLRRFRTLFDASPVIAFTVDGEGNVREWNATATAFFGRPENEVIDRPLAMVLGYELFRGDLLGAWGDVLAGRTPDPVGLMLTGRGGLPMTTQWYMAPVKLDDETVVGAVFVVFAR